MTISDLVQRSCHVLGLDLWMPAPRQIVIVDIPTKTPLAKKSLERHGTGSIWYKNSHNEAETGHAVNGCPKVERGWKAPRTKNVEEWTIGKAHRSGKECNRGRCLTLFVPAIGSGKAPQHRQTSPIFVPFPQSRPPIVTRLTGSAITALPSKRYV